MTEWILTSWKGEAFRLPHPLTFQIHYGLGAACDSFQVACPWAGGEESILADGVRMTVKWKGDVVFYGVVDECECVWSENGSTVEILGRGLQALLLDNETAGVDYGVATLEDILRRYVTPFGISVAERAALPSVPGFSVASGSSCWQVLYQFARYYGGVTPRFDRKGRLLLSKWNETVVRKLDHKTALQKMVLRVKRYGVLSHIQVINRVTMASQTVVNESFREQGGCSGKVMTMPRDSGYQKLRYNGRFQLERSKSELRCIEVSLGEAFSAWPGELVETQWPRWNANGKYRVLESTVQMDAGGYQTVLRMGDPEAVL